MSSVVTSQPMRENRWLRTVLRGSSFAVPSLALVIIAAVVLAARGASGTLVLFAAVPALAIVQRAGPRRFHVVGAATFTVCAGLAVVRWRADPLATAAAVVTVMTVCGAGCLNCRSRLAD